MASSRKRPTRQRPRRLSGKIKLGIRQAGERRQKIEELRSQGYIVEETPEGLVYYKPKKVLSRQERFEKYGHVSSPVPAWKKAGFDRPPKKKIELKKKEGKWEVVSTEGYFSESEVEYALQKIETNVDLDTAVQEQRFAKLHPVQQVGETLAFSITEIGAGIVTFPEFILEEGVGRVHSYIEGKGLEAKDYISKDLPFSREKIGEWVEERYTGSPRGLIAKGIEHVAGGGTSWKTEQKYPVLTGIATIGEIATLWTGAKVAAFSRAVIRRGATKIGVPSLTQYRPTQLARKAVWKAKEKLGYAERIPEEAVWDPGVLKGEKVFAEAKGPRGMIKAFEKSKVAGTYKGVHAAPQRFGGMFRKTTVTKMGTSETAGLSVSAYGRGSPYFLKIADLQPAYYSKTTLLPKIRTAQAPVISFESLYRLPKKLRTGASYEKVSTYLKGQPRGKYATIAAKAERGGIEIEAIVTGGSKLVKKTPKKAPYTTFRGVVVELPGWETTGVGVPMGATRVGRIGGAVKGRVSKSILSYEPSSSVLKPSYLVSKTTSYRSSKTSSYISSVNSSITSSKASSVISSKVSSVVSSKSYISSAAPSYGPSAKYLPILIAPKPKYKKRKYKKLKKKAPRGARRRTHEIRLLESII